MEHNSVLQAQEALDISVLLKSVSDDIAFQMVVNLFTKAHEENRDLDDYFDYIWCEHGNGARWDYAVKMHNESQSHLNDLEVILGELLAAQAKNWKGIPQLIGEKIIDIKYLLYEMPSDIGIDFINGYLEHIDYILRHFERERGSKNDTEERKREEGYLANLQNILVAIREDEANAEREFEKEWEKVQIAEAEERREMWEYAQQKEPEAQTDNEVKILCDYPTVRTTTHATTTNSN